VLGLVLAGICISWLGARATAHSAAQHSRESFRLAAAQVDGSMDLEVQHETDLLEAAGAFMQEGRQFDPRAYQRWAANVGVLTRYPELVSLSAILPASRKVSGCPRVTTVGRHMPARMRSAGALDICRGQPILDRTRDSGRLIDFGFSASPGEQLYGEALPVYRTPTAPDALAGRRRLFLGWVVISVYPHVLMRQAIARFPDLRLTIRTTAANKLTFTTGPDVHSASVRASIANGTAEYISGSVKGGSIFDDVTSTLILLSGSALSLLIGLVVSLLGTSRERAMRLVGEMTGELAFQALHDGLTGLPNRTLLMDRAAHAVARAARGTRPAAVLFIDVDGFKGVNDTRGHDAGDQVLRAIAGRLHEVVRESDTVGRFGGDEFAVLLEPQGSAAEPELVAERILEVLRQPIELAAGGEVRVTASIGIATGPSESADDLLRDAALALYAAKAAGRDRLVTFVDEMQVALAARRSLELDLKSAVANDELFLLYQPTFHLGDGTLRGVEALLRWQHPEHGVVPPDQFIPIAEETGLIIEIGRWVAEQACRQASLWQARGVQMVMAINVSGRQLDEDSFAADIADIIDETDLEPASVVLEITETALMGDPTAAAARLEELKRLGVRIAVDDFGTGYSSLAYLRQFPVDSLKIDRSFVSAIGSSSDATALVRTLVQLGKTLHLTTLGEGIENMEQLSELRRAGCDLAQGFLLARPLAAEKIDEMLDEGTLKTAPVASYIPQWADHLAETGRRESYSAIA
jgi:diguanylate cyclase (GGDEF)-like protein